MKKFTLIFLLFFGTSAYTYAAGCSDIQVPGLEVTQLEELRLQCQQKKTQLAKQADGVMTPETVESHMQKWSAYGKFAKEIAQAIGVLAEELNMKINDFLKTDAGKLAVALLIWKIFGEGIFGVVMGLILLYVIYRFTTFAINRLWRKEWEDKTVKVLFGLLPDKVVRKPVYARFYDLSEGEQAFAVVAFVLGIAASLLTVCVVIF